MIIQGTLFGVEGHPYVGAVIVRDMTGADVPFRSLDDGDPFNVNAIQVGDGKVNIEVYGNPAILIVVGQDAPTTAYVVNGVWRDYNILTEIDGNIAYGTDMVGHFQVNSFPAGTFALSGEVQAGAGATTTLCYVPPTFVPSTGAATLCTVAGVLTVATIAAVTGEVAVAGAPNPGDRIKMLGCIWTVVV
jgi:hypothetical protein